MNERNSSDLRLELEKEINSDPILEEFSRLHQGTLNELVVKNLENVQGDERDIRRCRAWNNSIYLCLNYNYVLEFPIICTHQTFPVLSWYQLSPRCVALGFKMISLPILLLNQTFRTSYSPS